MSGQETLLLSSPLPLPDVTLEQIKTAKATLQADPIAALLYLRDIIVYTLTLRSPALVRRGSWSYTPGDEFGLNPSSVNSAGHANPALDVVLDILVRDGGEAFVADLASLITVPPEELNEPSLAEEMCSLVSGFSWLLLTASPEFKSLWQEHALNASLGSLYMMNDDVSGGRSSVGRLLFPFSDHEGFRKLLKERLNSEDPWKSVLVMQALLRHDFHMPDLIDLGALQCLSTCLETLDHVSTPLVKGLVGLVKEAIRIMYPRNHQGLRSNDAVSPSSANRIRMTLETGFLCPSNIDALAASWLSQPEIVSSAALSELIADISHQNAGAKSSVMKLVYEKLDNVDVEGPDGDGVVAALSTFLGQASVPFELKKPLIKERRAVDVLIRALYLPRAHSVPPYAAEHMAAHALAILIPIDSTRTIQDQLLASTESFKSVIQSLTRISEYDPFSEIRPATGDGVMGGPLLLNTVLEEWHKADTIFFDEFVPRMFDPTRNTNPCYGAAILLQHLSHHNVVDAFIKAGIVNFCFSVAINNVPGEGPWLHSIELLSFLASYHAGVVDVLDVDGRLGLLVDWLEPVQPANARDAVAGLISHLAKNMSEDDVLRLRNAGIVGSLVTFAVEDSVSPSEKSKTIPALKEMAIKSPIVQDDLNDRHEMADQVVDMLFFSADKPGMQSDPTEDAASLLPHLLPSGSHIVEVRIRHRIAEATSFGERIALLDPIQAALAIRDPDPALPSTIVSAGVIPLIFQIITDPAFLSSENLNLRATVVHLLNETILKHNVAHEELLETPPGLVNIYIAWVTGGDLALKEAGYTGLIAVLSWTDVSEDDDLLQISTLDIRLKMLDPSSGLLGTIVRDMSRRYRSRSSLEFAKVAVREARERSRLQALTLMDALCADAQTFHAARDAFVHAGVVLALENLKKMKLTRLLAVKLLRRLDRDDLLEEGFESDTGLETASFEVLCDVIADSEYDVREQVAAMKEMIPMLGNPRMQATLAQRPAVDRRLVVSMLGKTDSALLTVPEKKPLTPEEVDDMAVAARDNLDNIVLSDPLQPLALLTIDVLRAELKISLAHTLQTIRMVMEGGTGIVRELFMQADLPEFIVRVLRGSAVTTVAVRSAVEVIETVAAGDKLEHNCREFVTAGTLKAFSAVIESASSDKEPSGFKRLVPFKAMAILVSHGNPESPAPLADSVPKLVDQAVAELNRGLEEDSPENGLAEEEKEWGNIFALSVARIAPLTFLDCLLSCPQTFTEIQKLVDREDVRKVLEMVRDDSREPGQFDFGMRGDMSNMATEILGRLNRSDLPTSLRCSCGRCEQGYRENDP